MRKNKTFTSSIKPSILARLSMFSKKYNTPKNKMIELALLRMFETAVKAELDITFKIAKRDRVIRAFCKNAEDDAPGRASVKKVKQKEIYYADLNPRGRGGKRAPVPVVIISGNTINSRLGMSIVCPIRENVRYRGGSVTLKKDKLNKLKSDSQILAFQVKTIGHERLIKKIGEITDKQLSETKMWLRDVLKW